jgi:hypothetical protein
MGRTHRGRFAGYFSVAGLGALALSVSCGSERSPFRPLGGSAGADGGKAGSGAANAGGAGRGGGSATGGQVNTGGSSGASAATAGSSGGGGKAGNGGGKGGSGGANAGTGGKGNPMGGVAGDGGEGAGTAGGGAGDAGGSGLGGSDGGSGNGGSGGAGPIEFHACITDSALTRLTIQRIDASAMTCVVITLEQDVGGCQLGLTSDSWCFARAHAFDTTACSGNASIATAASGTFSVSGPGPTSIVELDVMLDFPNASPVGEQLTVELENCVADCSGEECRSP